jgi:hypothetical protein
MLDAFSPRGSKTHKRIKIIMSSPSPQIAAFATSACISGALFAHFHSSIHNVRMEIAALQKAVSSCHEHSTNAETAAARAANSFSAVATSLRSSAVAADVSNDIITSAAESVAIRTTRESVVPVLNEIQRVAAAIDDIEMSAGAIENRFQNMETRLGKIETLLAPALLRQKTVALDDKQQQQSVTSATDDVVKKITTTVVKPL